jgi:hypothetical protein
LVADLDFRPNREIAPEVLTVKKYHRCKTRAAQDKRIARLAKVDVPHVIATDLPLATERIALALVGEIAVTHICAVSRRAARLGHWAPLLQKIIRAVSSGST